MKKLSGLDSKKDLKSTKTKLSTAQLRAEEKLRLERKQETLGAAKALLQNVQEIKKTADRMKDEVVKREAVRVPASNFRADKSEKTDMKKLEQKVLAAITNANNTNTSKSKSSQSLPKIKHSRSGTLSPNGKMSGMMSPKKSQSGFMSPNGKMQKSQSGIMSPNGKMQKSQSGIMSPKKSKSRDLKKSRSSSLIPPSPTKSQQIRRSSNQVLPNSHSFANLDSPGKSPNDQSMPLFSIGSPGEELASPTNEPIIINEDKEKISVEKFKSMQQPITRKDSNGRNIPLKSMSTSSISSPRKLEVPPLRKVGTTGPFPHYDIHEDAVPFTAGSGNFRKYSNRPFAKFLKIF